MPTDDIRKQVDEMIHIPQDWITEHERRTIDEIAHITEQRMMRSLPQTQRNEVDHAD